MRINGSTNGGFINPVRRSAISPSDSFANRVASLSSNNGTTEASTILQKYDLKNISYNEIVSLGEELRKVGAITGEEQMDLATPVFLPVNPEGVPWTEESKGKRMNLLANSSMLVDVTRQQRPGDLQSLKFSENLRDLVSRLESFRNG